MITAEQVAEYFASIGITIPSFMIDCIVVKANSVIDCMIAGGYEECDITMALLIASALLGLSMGARKVASQSADVVSQSYKYDSMADLTDMLEDNLAVFDPNGCTNSIIPNTGGAFAFVTTGGGNCCG